jgi:hypothetical protein
MKVYRTIPFGGLPTDPNTFLSPRLLAKVGEVSVNPYPATISRPAISKNEAMCSGKAEPPDTITFNLYIHMYIYKHIYKYVWKSSHSEGGIWIFVNLYMYIYIYIFLYVIPA